jgi:hypothetical protein
MDVSQGCEVLQNKVEEEHACHFEVRVGKRARWIVKGYDGVADVIGPLHAPDDGGQGAGPGEPNATCAERGGVTETYVPWFTYNKFSTVGWA